MIPLVEAARCRDENTVKMLVSSKADVEARDANGNTALMVKYAAIKCAKILVDAKADPYAKDRMDTLLWFGPHSMAAQHLRPSSYQRFSTSHNPTL